MATDNREIVSPDLFYHGKVPGPLSQEERAWLAKQLREWPHRVDEARTCAIGALTDMAMTEFCRLYAEASQLSGVVGERDRLRSALILIEFYSDSEYAREKARAALNNTGGQSDEHI